MSHQSQAWRLAASEHLPANLSASDASLLTNVGVPSMWFMEPNPLDTQAAKVADIHDRHLMRLGGDGVTAIWLDIDGGEVLTGLDDRLDTDHAQALSVVNTSLAAFQRSCAAWHEAAAEAEAIQAREGYEAGIALAEPLRTKLAAIDPKPLRDQDGLWSVWVWEWAQGL